MRKHLQNGKLSFVDFSKVESLFWLIELNFVSEFFIYAQHLQQPDKEEFLKMLLNNGILHAIEILLDSKWAKVRTLGADLICQIVEIHQHPSSVREHILKNRYYNQVKTFIFRTPIKFRQG